MVLAGAVMMPLGTRLGHGWDTARRNTYADTVTERNAEAVRSGNCFASFVAINSSELTPF